MKQELVEQDVEAHIDRAALVRELARMTRMAIEPSRLVEVAKLSATGLETVGPDFDAEAFNRQPADFVVVLRYSVDE
jgi:hypothetical protein